MKNHYLIISFLLFCSTGFAQDLKQLLTTYSTGKSAEKVRAANELMNYYIGENKDTLEILGEELFQYGIENHYYPAIETGKIIIAEFYVETGKTNDGIAMAKSLVSTIEDRGDYEKLSIVSKLISQGYRFDKDASSTLYWAQQAVKSSEKSDDPEVQTFGYLSLAEAYVLNKKPNLAIKYFKLYIKKATPLKLNRGMCSAYARLGDIYRIEGNLVKAEFYFNASYKLAKKINRTVSLGHAINNLAIVYFERGDTTKARNYFENALELRIKNKDINAICESYYNLGDYQFYTGKTQSAINWYKKSYNYAKQHNLTPQAKDALIVLSNAYKSLGMYKESSEALEECLNLDDKMKVQHQKDEQKIKEKHLELMKMELNAEKEGYEENASFSDYLDPKWILISFLGVLSLFLTLKLRKRNAA